MKTTASPHLLIVTASLLAAIAFAAEGYATSPDDNAVKTNATAQTAPPSTAKEPLPAEIAANPSSASNKKETSQKATPAPVGNAKSNAASKAPDAPVASVVTATAPENAEVILPPVIVESPAPVLSTDVVLTNKGAGAAARDRQFSGDVDRTLNSKTLPLVGKTPEERALTKEQEEKRLAQIEDTKAAAYSLKETKPAEAAELKKDAYDMSVRPNSFNEDLPPSVRRDAPR